MKYIWNLFIGSLGIFWVQFLITPDQVHAQQESIVFEDFEHADPFNNGWFIFYGPNGVGEVGINQNGNNSVQQTRWEPTTETGYIGGFGRSNPVSIKGMTHFSFWINPLKGSNYTLEVNLQEDDDLDGKANKEKDDEFQFDVIVSDIGPGAIATSGWQKVSIPLADFYDDNSYMQNGNGVFDALVGDRKLINVVFAIINHAGDEIEFQTDNWKFVNLPVNQDSRSANHKILFVGNSYTFYNNMPQLFFKLAESGGKNILVDQSTFAGYWLDNHLTNDHTLHKLQKEDWDYVIIQEQSQVPTVKYWRESSMKPVAEILNTIIRERGAETVLFMTWGRQNGGVQMLYDYSSSDFQNYNHMQDSLEKSYRELATYLDATLAPVGLAWENALIINPELKLWDEDQSHPTYEGSYLTACVFYTVLFKESPVGLEFIGNLEPEMAWFLQSMASTALVTSKMNLSVNN